MRVASFVCPDITMRNAVAITVLRSGESSLVCPRTHRSIPRVNGGAIRGQGTGQCGTAVVVKRRQQRIYVEQIAYRTKTATTGRISNEVVTQRPNSTKDIVRKSGRPGVQRDNGIDKLH